jgi:hypothetical protein
LRELAEQIVAVRQSQSQLEDDLRRLQLELVESAHEVLHMMQTSANLAGS